MSKIEASFNIADESMEIDFDLAEREVVVTWEGDEVATYAHTAGDLFIQESGVIGDTEIPPAYFKGFSKLRDWFTVAYDASDQFVSLYFTKGNETLERYEDQWVGLVKADDPDNGKDRCGYEWCEKRELWELRCTEPQYERQAQFSTFKEIGIHFFGPEFEVIEQEVARHLGRQAAEGEGCHRVEDVR